MTTNFKDSKHCARTGERSPRLNALAGSHSPVQPPAPSEHVDRTGTTPRSAHLSPFIVSDAAVTTRINFAQAAVGDSGEEQRLIKTLPSAWLPFPSSFASTCWRQGRLVTALPLSMMNVCADRFALKILPVKLPVRKWPVVKWPVVMVTLKNWTLSPVAQLFISSLRQAFRSPAVEGHQMNRCSSEACLERVINGGQMPPPGASALRPGPAGCRAPVGAWRPGSNYTRDGCPEGRDRRLC